MCLIDVGDLRSTCGEREGAVGKCASKKGTGQQKDVVLAENHDAAAFCCFFFLQIAQRDI
jgi:hypothetical protein